jgi:murein DD-endopeptidase MepM/ murein hydrolase activator NlpD
VELFWEDEAISYSVPCLIPIPLGQEPYLATIRFHFLYREIDQTLSLIIPVSNVALPTESIDLPPASQDLLSEEFLQREREILYAVLDQPSSQPPTLGWALPVSNPVISAFGTVRDYGELGYDYHYGIDFRGEEGDLVRASASGTVVLAQELYSRGNTLVLAHGGGLFSLYYHLSSFLIQVGDPVSQGQIIGRVGQTGAVTGPHLHWEARIGRIPVNPLQFLLKNPH